MGRRRRAKPADELTPEIDEPFVEPDEEDDDVTYNETPEAPPAFDGPPGDDWQEAPAFTAPPPPPVALHRPPPLVASVPGDAVQFDVQRLENGRPQDIGDIDVRATVYDLIAKFGKPGTYWLTPKDMQGNPLTSQPYVKDIGADHVAFKALADAPIAGPDGMLGGMAASGMPMQFWALMQEQQRRAEAREQALLHRVDAVEKARDEERQRISEIQVAMAVDNTASALETQKTLLEQHKGMTEQGMSQIVQMMTLMQSQQQAQADQAIARERAAAGRAQAESEARLERMRAQEDLRLERIRAETEREREREKDRRAAEAAEADRRERERERMSAAQQKMAQEHQAMMLATIKERGDANDPANFLAQAGTLITMAKDLGLDKLLGAGGPAGWGELIAGTLQEGIKGLVELRKLDATVEGDEGADDPILQVKLPNGQIVQMPQSEFMALQAQQAQQQQQQQIIGPQTSEEAPVAENPRQAAVNALPADVRKAARTALRTLVGEIERTPDRGQWEGKVIQAIMATPAIYHYIRASGIRPAIVEAGAAENLASAIMQVIEASGKVPADVPRT